MTRGENGFTLLEVLVAITIGVLLITAAIQAFRGINDAQLIIAGRDRIQGRELDPRQEKVRAPVGNVFFSIFDPAAGADVTFDNPVGASSIISRLKKSFPVYPD